MTRCILDTNIVSDLIRNLQVRAARQIVNVGEDNICTSIIVAAELRYGCAKSGLKRLLKVVEDLLAVINVLPLDIPADAQYGRIRSMSKAARQADRGQRPADCHPRLYNRHHNRDRQYRGVQTYPRSERGEWLALRRPIWRPSDRQYQHDVGGERRRVTEGGASSEEDPFYADGPRRASIRPIASLNRRMWRSRAGANFLKKSH